jgi:hypothetical protein
MEAVYSSETSVDFQRTKRRCIPEVSTLHNHHCKNLKSYNASLVLATNFALKNFYFYLSRSRSWLVQFRLLFAWNLANVPTITYSFYYWKPLPVIFNCCNLSFCRSFQTPKWSLPVIISKYLIQNKERVRIIIFVSWRVCTPVSPDEAVVWRNSSVLSCLDNHDS